MQDEKPIVSVIMPSLNVIKYIDECIESVLNQSLKRIEIICVDAGSTDGTYERLKEYEKKDTRVHVIQSDKKSYGYQVNLGIKESEAKYIGIVETDDYIDENMYETLYQMAEKNELDYVKADFTFFRDIDGYYVYSPGKLFDDNTEQFYNKVIKPLDCKYLYFHDFNVWKGIYNREFLIENGILFNESSGAAFQDIGFQQLLLYYAERCMYIPEKFYYYRYGHMINSSVSPKLLKFVRQEFGYLIDEKLKGAYGQKIELIYQKLAMDLWSQYNVLLDINEKEIESEEVEQCYVWLRKRLVDIFDNGIAKNVDISNDVWKQIQYLLNDKESYTKDYLARKCNEIDGRKRGLGSENVIWGCGTYGMQALDFLQKYGYKCIALTDSNSGLWGKEVNGVKIQEPVDVMQNNKKITYIIANKYHSEEIKEQLKNNGVQENNIIIWK